MGREQLLSLIDEIYTAAADPRHWEAVARRIQSTIGGHSVNLIFENRADRRLNFAFSTTLGLEDLIRYQRDYMATDELGALFEFAKPDRLDLIAMAEGLAPDVLSGDGHEPGRFHAFEYRATEVPEPLLAREHPLDQLRPPRRDLPLRRRNDEPPAQRDLG